MEEHGTVKRDAAAMYLYEKRPPHAHPPPLDQHSLTCEKTNVKGRICS